MHMLLIAVFTMFICSCSSPGFYWFPTTSCWCVWSCS